ncbi:hypothetical protein [uncultured Amnibacterium sp.]|uniref:hypothetical protein n=1 Tax=uncultured Amnibacterium sp. TaxID=1631851 RepID=UPI0035CBF1CC
MRRRVIAVVAAIGVATAMVTGSTPANAAYTDPLTRGDLVDYNHHDYRLSITPVAGAKKVVRNGHSIPSTYVVRVVEPQKRGDRLIFRGTLGYYRTAYLRLKTVSADVVRPYGMAAYLDKVTGFSAAHAKQRVDAFTVEWRHRTLRLDVESTVNQVADYIAHHGDAAGIEQHTELVIRSDGFFGYEHASIRLFRANAYQDGAAPDDFVVYGFDPTDGYQVMYSSYTGLTRTARTEDSLALLA